MLVDFLTRNSEGWSNVIHTSRSSISFPIVLHFPHTFDTIHNTIDCGHVEWFMHFSKVDNTLYCSFSGRLDGSICSEIEHDLLQHVSDFKKDHENKEDTRLNFDLSEVIYISSAFLRLCLICFKIFGKDCFSVTNTSGEIHNVFRISGFTDIIHVTMAGTTPNTSSPECQRCKI